MRIAAGKDYLVLVTQLGDVCTLWRAPMSPLAFAPTRPSLTGAGTVDLSVAAPVTPACGPSDVLLDRNPAAGLLVSATGAHWVHRARLEHLDTNSVITFVLTNATRTTCTVWGFSRLVFTDAAGTRLGVPIQPSPTGDFVSPRSLVPVVLQPGRRVSFFCSDPQGPPPRRDPVHPGDRGVRFPPPGSAGSVSLTVAFNDCGPVENVSPIVQGLQPPEIG